MPEPRSDRRAPIAVVAALVGGATGGVTSAATRLDDPLRYGLYAALVALVGAWLIAPSIVRGRPRSILALAVVVYVLGILAFPPASLLLGLEAPGGPSPRTPVEAVQMYAATPLAFAFAVPFLPAVLVTAFAAAAANEWLGGDEDGATSAGAGPDVRHEEPTLAADTDDADAAFARRVGCAVAAIVVAAVASFWLLVQALSGIGY